MAKTIDRLSALQIRNMRRPGKYHDGGGLYLQVAAGGSKSWLFCYQRQGKQHWMGLGSLKTFSLAEARDRAREQRQLLWSGSDPIAANRERKKAATMPHAQLMTFDRAAEQFIEANAPGWKNEKHSAQWTSTLRTYVSPVFGDAAVDQVDTAMVLAALRPIWLNKTETAARVRGRIEKILDWATAHGHRLGSNPAAWHGHLQQLLPAPKKIAKASHHEALPWRDVADFMAKLRAVPGVVSMATQFIVLTASRTGEAIGARWSEFDFANSSWTVPASRMKAAKEHRVPLSPPLLELLNAVKAQWTGEYVFPGRIGSHLSNMACLTMLKRLGYENLTIHGFRSTFRDWAAETTDFPSEVCELALAHTISNAVEAAYRRGDLMEKRRKLMEQWATYCLTAPEPSRRHGRRRVELVA